MNSSVSSTVTQTLFANGFLMTSGRRLPDVLVLRCSRFDEFGVEVRYAIAVGESQVRRQTLALLRRIGQREGAHPIVVGEPVVPTEIPSLSLGQFLARMGGEVRNLLPLHACFTERLRILARNQLPAGLQGRPDDLFEVYVTHGLQFIFGARALRYGQDRRGESVPDGIVLRGHTYLLYDAKASGSSYEITADSLRQFADYVRDFTRRYGQSLGNPYTFLVVAGEFADTAEARSNKLRATTLTTHLTLMTAEDLGLACKFFASNPALRQGVNWEEAFSGPVATFEGIREAALGAGRNGILGRR